MSKVHFPGSGPEPEWPVDRPDYTSLQAAVQAEAARHNVPGLSIGVWQDGQTDVAVAGFANLEAKRPVTEKTLFQIGSISKVFTATLVMQLVQEGKLDLDEPVRTYLPDLKLKDKSAQNTITLRHLLNHTNGIEGDYFVNAGHGDDTLANVINNDLPNLKQWHKPGETWAYSNIAFSLTGRIIEVVCDQLFETVMQEKLLGPLGTPDITLFAVDTIVRDFAVGYNLPSRNGTHKLADPLYFSRYVTPAGALMSPVDQLLKFAAMHIQRGSIDGKSLLNPALVREMQVPRQETIDGMSPFGVGWVVRKYGEEVSISHNGGTNGQRALLIVLPERKFAFAALSNGAYGANANNALAEWALQRYRGIKPTAPADAVSLSAAKLKKWEGTWERPDRTMKIQAKDGKLVASAKHLDKELSETDGLDETTVWEMEPLSETSFRITNGDFKGVGVNFLDMPDGRALVRLGSRFAERVSK